LNTSREYSKFSISSCLKILLVVSNYLPNRGGLQTVTSTLAAELQQREIIVSVLAQRYPRALSAKEKIDGVRVQRLLFLTPRLRDLQKRRLDLFLASLFYFPTTLIRLSWLIVRDKPDVVNLHFVGAPALFLLIAHAFLHFRYIVSLHGDDVEGLSRGTWFDRWVFHVTLRQADGVTACSRYLLEKVQAVEPSIVGKASVIYNGMQIEDARTVVSNDGILAVGRMVPKKGFDVLLRAFAECRRATKTLRLNLIGDGPERGALESLAHELGLIDCVAFLGSQDHEAVVRTMQTSQFVVVPSRDEPFGLVALEAMAVGKPVVATPVGGLPEVLEGADAVLVEPDNPMVLAEAITAMLARIEREPQFGSHNREVAARFSITRMVDGYVQVYAAPERGL
jgi:glycogen synthase